MVAAVMETTDQLPLMGAGVTPVTWIEVRRLVKAVRSALTLNSPFGHLTNTLR